MPVGSGNERDNISMKVLISRIVELEKLQEAKMEAAKIKGIHQWNRTLWNQQKNLEKQFNFGDYVLWFPKGNKSHLGKFIRKWFGPYRVQYVLPNSTMLLVTIHKFKTSPILINVNKFKPYKYMESEAQIQEQQMPIYWEQSVSGVQAEDSNTKEEDEDCEMQKPQIQSTKDEKKLKDSMVSTILIFELHMINKYVGNSYRS